jgi:uncharacterized protein
MGGDRIGRYEVQMQWDVKIPMRDGVCLSAIAYLPQNLGHASPAIVALTPYTAQSCHEQGLYFAEHGYAFLAVDVRGRGNSEGRFHPIDVAQDGHDIVQWLARQPYCNRKVAMWGSSYMGYAQWATAREFPPGLVAIAPAASPFRGVDSPMRNNVFASFTLQWLVGIGGRTLQEKVFSDQTFWRDRFKRWFESGAPFREFDTFLSAPSPIFQEWIRHSQRDAYWDRYNPSPAQYARIDLPILSITGIYDGDQLGALMHYREHIKACSEAERAHHYLVIGPWDHYGTRTPRAEFGGLKLGQASLVDLAQLHLQWYDWTMRGGAKPQFLRKNVAYYVMGAEEWRYADSLESVTERYEPLYLHSTANPVDVFRAGSLKSAPQPDSKADWYVYDPRDTSHAELESTVDPESRVDQRMLHACVGGQLIYHTAPFSRDTDVAGFFRFTAWMAIDQPDTDFRVTVYEIGIDGSSIQLTTDWMRARFRESFRESTLIDTTEPLCYEFERFMFVARRIKKGHRLRLVIGPINSIYWQKNYNSGGTAWEESIADARPVQVRVFHDSAHPSALHVPVARSSRECRCSK